MGSGKVKRRTQCFAPEKHSQTKKKKRGLWRVGWGFTPCSAGERLSRVNHLRTTTTHFITHLEIYNLFKKVGRMRMSILLEENWAVGSLPPGYCAVCS